MGQSSAVAPNPQQLPFLNMTDLPLVGMDIKSTLSAAIADLKMEIRAVASRFDHMEAAAITHGAPIEQVQIFQDLSPITLQQRRALRPLLNVL